MNKFFKRYRFLTYNRNYIVRLNVKAFQDQTIKICNCYTFPIFNIDYIGSVNWNHVTHTLAEIYVSHCIITKSGWFSYVRKSVVIKANKPVIYL